MTATNRLPSSNYVRLCAVDALTEGLPTRVVVNDVAICLVMLSGEFQAIDDSCTHEGASLSDGLLVGYVIECPMHGSQFDVRTGAVIGLPAEEPLKTYQVQVIGGDVYADVGSVDTFSADA